MAELPGNRQWKWQSVEKVDAFILFKGANTTDSV